MKIFLTFFLFALLFSLAYGAEVGVENVKGLENEEIRGVHAEKPLGRHKRWGWGWGGYGGWGGGGCCWGR
ncbi:hypothetical protein ACQ4LE_001456 [Meloidogyne hapla]|uniref:Uncharacterized protein n=1 Tax=Meloidogyne hapla TaxID=6305 RepID=A0A1I8BCB0_MELHA